MAFLVKLLGKALGYFGGKWIDKLLTSFVGAYFAKRKADKIHAQTAKALKDAIERDDPKLFLNKLK